MPRTQFKTKNAKLTDKKLADKSMNASPQKIKLDTLVELPSCPGGTTIVEISEATGWLTRSVRGALPLERQRPFGECDKLR